MMKKNILMKTIILMIFVVLLSVSICYGKTNTYIINDEYNFEVTENLPQNAYVKIHIGNINATPYSHGTIDVYPLPNEVLEDDYGNKILKYNYSSLAEKKGEQFVVNVNKSISTNDKDNIYNTNVSFENLTKYLSSVPRIETDNPYIISKVEEVTKDCTTDYEKLEKIFEFVNMYLTYDTSSTYRNKGALSALLNGRGVCEEYATLFCAFSRVCNIPARIITGYNTENLVLNEKTDSLPSYHAWAEVYLEEKGWTPLEITAEYYKNGKKEPYWKGFLQLPEQASYVVEGIYNNELNEIEWYGINLNDYNKYITLTDERYFTDIDEHWAKGYIENLYDAKIINGYEDETFLPDNNVTRAEYICMLSRMVKHLNMHYYDITDIYYTQDFEDNWAKQDYDNLMKYYAFYAQDTENGAGYKTITYVFDETFDMNKAILREEVVALLAPFLKHVEDGDAPLVDIEDSKFKKEIISSYINNVIVGYEDNTFKPEQTITRGEIATIFDRIINKEK